MILGLGVDLVDIRRVEKVLARHGERFTRRCFTEIERARSDGRAARAASYAKRYAAKEAAAKALGTGIAQGVSWQEIGVVNAPGGRPDLVLTGRALARLASMTPAGFQARAFLTITDEPPYAQAQVIIEAHPIADLAWAQIGASA
jgi:phosphopantethiene--protein transferase domain